MTIHELRLEIKGLAERLNNRDVYTVLLIMLVGFGSFGLGRLSKLQEQKQPIRIIDTLAEVSGASAVSALAPAKAALPPADAEKPMNAGGQLVASKTGSKYHFPWCSGAQRISEANKVWFNSVEEARKAGYTPASNCKGLK